MNTVKSGLPYVLLSAIILCVGWAIMSADAGVSFVKLPMDPISFELTETAVSSSALTTIGSGTAEIALSLYGQSAYVSFEICNTGTNAFTDVLLQRQVHPSAEWDTHEDTWSSTGLKTLIYTTTDLDVIDSNGCESADVAVNGCWAIRWQAQAETGDGATGTAQVRGTVRPAY